VLVGCTRSTTDQILEKKWEDHDTAQQLQTSRKSMIQFEGSNVYSFGG
jgi:hypothetical protein